MSSEFEERAFLERRLTLAIATPIALLILMGILLGAQLLKMADDAAWVDHTDQVISVAYKTKLEMIEQETSVRGYIVNGERDFLDAFERASPHQGFDQLRSLVADNPPQQVRFAQARRRYDQWLAMATSIVNSGDLAAARSPENMRGRKERMDGVREAMRGAIDVEDNLRVARLAASQASIATTKWAFVGLLTAVAALLAFFSRRQLGIIGSTFGVALEAQRVANAAIEKESWIRQGQAELVDVLQGEKTPVQVGADCLATLARYTRAHVGAFFIRESETWHRRAGFALDSRAAGAETFADGEGIVGRAALEGKVLELRDLPADFLKLRSGTGESAPVQVVIVPACVEGSTLAVVELGFFGPVEARAVELLKRVGENVALAVQSSTYKARLRHFLDETQRQAEELQAQQEELRVQNEELEQQARVLHDAHMRMQTQQVELEQINSQLEEQTQTLERQRDELSRSEGELRLANEYKSEFLANMSHELRTPLNSSLILAKLLADNRKGNLDQEEIQFAQTIYSAGNDLLTLINDILDLSKIEAGKLDVTVEPVGVARLVNELENAFKPIAKQNNLELIMSVDANVPVAITTDATRLQQILKNLLSNALKFTERGGVTLSVRQTSDGSLAFDVKDTGIGIPAQYHETIFEAFRQADGTTNRKYGGTGLGLSISRDLAQLLGGQLTLDSAPGRGSTFTLTLPLGFERVVAEAAPQRARVNAPQRPRADVATPQERSQPHAMIPDDREHLVAGSRSILIIEDDPNFAKVLRDLAHELQFQALIAQSAEAGLAMATRHQPSAIILDVGLPDRSGLSVLDALKHNPATRHIPVHMMSGTDHAQAALEMGAMGYAIKPIAREQLVGALKRLESKFTQSHRRILVVEDDEVHRESTCRLLAGPDVETVAVGTAKAALVQLEQATFDCMVLDLTLPDRTGFELLQEMAQKEQYGFPPVIVYTGRSLSRDEEQQLRRFSQSIIIKGARSPERLLDEVTLFLHQVEDDLPVERQRMLREARHRDAVFEGRRVLIVEDDVRNIFALQSVLEPKGAKIEIARNGKEALAHLNDKPGVDLVLMDIMMPVMDGLQATRELRKQPQHAKLPIIALTAKAMVDDRENCLAAGASDYIAKPLDVDKLLSLARVWMPK